MLVAALALLVALLAACKSDSNGGKTPTSDKSPASGQSPTAQGTPTAGSGGQQDLEKLASEAAAGVTAKVTYKYTSQSGGQTTEGEWTLAQRPPDSRFEIVSTQAGQETRQIVITTADKSYVCTSAGGSETCLKSTTDQTQAQSSLFAPLFDIPKTVAKDISGLGVVDKSEREIAGVHASCFSADAAVLGGASEFCFSDGGILLFLKSEAAGNSFTFEAKSASTDVTDADFQPPYKVVDVPTG